MEPTKPQKPTYFIQLTRGNNVMTVLVTSDPIACSEAWSDLLSLVSKAPRESLMIDSMEMKTNCNPDLFVVWRSAS